MNYLRPDIKRGNITPDEEDLIIRLHSLLGNRWSLIAGRLPGRTDNEIKNYWNTHLSKKFRSQRAYTSTHKGLTETLQQQAGAKRRKATKPEGQARRQRRGAVAKSHGAHGRVEKPKLHLPKAIRVKSSFSLPRNDSFMSNMASGCTSCNQGSEQSNYDDRQDGNRSGRGSGAEFVVGVEGLQGEEGGGGRDEGGLEKLYEEYLELLREGQDQDLAELDCFAESLLDLV